MSGVGEQVGWRWLRRAEQLVRMFGGEQEGSLGVVLHVGDAKRREDTRLVARPASESSLSRALRAQVSSQRPWNTSKTFKAWKQLSDGIRFKFWKVPSH